MLSGEDHLEANRHSLRAVGVTTARTKRSVLNYVGLIVQRRFLDVAKPPQPPSVRMTAPTNRTPLSERGVGHRQRFGASVRAGGCIAAASLPERKAALFIFFSVRLGGSVQLT